MNLNFDENAEQLQADGVQAFIDSFRPLLNGLQLKRKEVLESVEL